MFEIDREIEGKRAWERGSECEIDRDRERASEREVVGVR